MFVKGYGKRPRPNSQSGWEGFHDHRGCPAPKRGSPVTGGLSSLVLATASFLRKQLHAGVKTDAGGRLGPRKQESLAKLRGRQPGSLAGREGTCWASGVLTHVKMEKKEKVMAARAASVPSFIGLSFGLDTCHWLARKQKPTNQRKAQKAGVFTRARQEGPRVRERVSGEDQGGVREHISHAPPPPKGEAGAGVGREGSTGKVRSEQGGRSDTEWDRDHRKEPAPWGQCSHEQSRGEPGAVRGGKEGETERKVSQPGRAFLSPQPHTDFPAESGLGTAACPAAVGEGQ